MNLPSQGVLAELILSKSMYHLSFLKFRRNFDEYFSVKIVADFSSIFCQIGPKFRSFLPVLVYNRWNTVIRLAA